MGSIARVAAAVAAILVREGLDYVQSVVAVRADFSVTLGRAPQSPVRQAAAVLAAQPLVLLCQSR